MAILPSKVTASKLVLHFLVPSYFAFETYGTFANIHSEIELIDRTTRGARRDDQGARLIEILVIVVMGIDNNSA